MLRAFCCCPLFFAHECGMVRVTMLLFTALFFLEKCWFCTCLVINPGSSGGLTSGDPAPGRSPGPPEIELTTLLLPQEADECGLEGNVQLATENFINLTLGHRLFITDHLVAGMEYQVNLKRIREGPVITFSIKSTVDGVPKGKFINTIDELNCWPNVFKSHLNGSALTLKWTMEDSEELAKTNLTFEVNYQVSDDPSVYRVIYSFPISQDCQLRLKKEEAVISWRDFPHSISDCQVWFPSHDTGHSLVIELTRLNVPCSKGYIHFSGLNITQHQQFRSHRQAHLCGKLEELPESDRNVYFPFSHTPPVMHTHGNPVFALSYHLVDYCYNVTFVARNGSFELKPTEELQCTFKIYLPYGNRVALNLQIGDSTSTGTPATDALLQNPKSGEKCDGLLTQLHDGDNTWSHCTKPGDAERRIEIVSRGNKVVLRVNVRSSNRGSLGLRMMYHATPIEEIVGACGFGWVTLKQFCVTAVEEFKLPWAQAEMECIRRGGHLASIRSDYAQNIINNLLLNSPGYRDHNAYWIGASDKIVEGDFRWSDGLPFSFTNWFLGWPQHGHYNRQPNDDGLSEQDCVEVRRIYSLPSASASVASAFMWNDRDCSTPNYFICERLINDEPLEDNWPPDCNRSVELSRQQPRSVVSSPGFPRHYPDNTDCDTDITAPPGYRLVLDFEELVLENEPSCSYDYLEILENNNVTSAINSTSARRLCGDWSSKLKLLRYVSNGSKLKLRFSSDYSHHFGGYKARVSMESASQCSDDRLHMFNNSCYLFVSYPEVTWSTAQEICKGKKGQLASILSTEEERFITTNIRKSIEYRTSALYWLGGKSETDSGFKWTDGNPMQYMGWLPGQKPADDTNVRCLGIQWTPSPTPMLPSGFYWKSRRCSTHGGYVCKKPSQISGVGINFNRTVNGSEGSLTSPYYPDHYYNHLDFSVRILGPDRTRLVVKFLKIDIEHQLECLYDFVELSSGGQIGDAVKFCGTHDTDMHRFNFVSEGNEAELRFHSDYSISGSGFSLTWHAVDVSACPLQTLTAKEGVLTSPNYPDFILAHLNCSVTILAPVGKRVWLEFHDYDIERTTLQGRGKNALLEVTLGKESLPFEPFESETLLTEGTFLSDEERLKISLRTGDRPSGKGFRAIYKIITSAQEEKIINLKQNSSGLLLHLNYPNNPPININFLQHFIAPLGCTISLEFFRVKLSDKECLDGNGVIEVYDNYYDTNGTSWKLCYDADTEDAIAPVTPISITSFLNTLHVRQKSGVVGVALNGSLRVQPDPEFKPKLLKHKDDEVESCSPNPCQNEGKCVTKEHQSFCQCTGHFIGLFCALTKCELEPCVFGTCHLTNSSYSCQCKPGYVGPNCEQKRKPCEGNPCESRGLCIERGDSFQCRCHAWWEGPRCEKRMLHIPYKPLSERMFHEPFWLGLMTVCVVMAVIGLVWCAKRHFPEKIEKLLAEENDRNRSTISSLRSSSVREQLAAASGAASVTVTPSPGPTAPRSLFGRLGIRKPSILSLTSPHASGYVPATARTFSLDDLLKPLPRRTPSPKKKRNNSTPTKKNAAEKKQILQQLISPGNKQLSRKVSLGELMQMSEKKLKESGEQKPDAESRIKETKFGEGDSVQSALNDPKLEKKVTFARLLNKVSAEMSSGSEMELGIMQSNRLGCVFARPSSTPPSPNVDARSPNSTSSNQGSDSFTSSDLAIPSALSSSISDLLSSRKNSRLPNGRQKPASADSILAMFRNFSASSAGANLPSSLKVSPSTTPTASSPQDDIVGDDESSTSSIHTPVSFSSGPPESPVLHRPSQSTIEVPVLDPLSAHKSPSSGSNFLHPPTILLEIPSTINKCLSPIREMPTPLPSPIPSPALTPIMRRSHISSSLEDAAEMSDDRMSVELPNISISDDDDMPCTQDIAIDPQAEDGLILEEAAAMHQNSTRKGKHRPPPLGQTVKSQPLVIPVLTIQTPSPTHSKTPSILFPGSPPPQKPHHQEPSFQFPPPKQNRKLYKDLDKPNSLDLPCAPPMITITCNMSEAESDAESISPAAKASGHLGGASAGMTYLSPFSIARGEHNASESNLSSSGYSSMASPGPSRCGSSNPLCPSEMEDQGPPGSGPSHRRPSPVLKTNSNPSERSDMDKKTEEQRRGRSDSETLSDDPLLESNDEGIGTDHIDEKIEEGDVKSAKELEVFMVSENENTKTLLDLPLIPPPTRPAKSIEDNMERLLPPPVAPAGKKTLQLPSIIVQCDGSGCEKLLSPMSSRSESPLSDRSGLDRFSPHFYGRHKDLLPFTDSDGLYDFSSTDKMNVMKMTQHKKTSKKRDKKLVRHCKTPSPTKPTNPLLPHNHLDVPSKDSFYKVPPPRKLSPKRRATRSQIVSSSSSSDSINSSREVRMSSSSPSPDTIRWSSPIDWLDEKCQQNAHEVDNYDDASSAMLPKAAPVTRHQKISRLRAISHQIRFLRRLELSLKRRERTVSPSDSLDSGGDDDSPRATSPLLQQSRSGKVEIQKSSSIGKLHSSQSSKTKRGKYKRGELLLPQQEEKSWKRIVITGNGHSD
ncbi:uncharacterized protein LOC103312261 isoform X4 [Tribolium castaneum]|uniref:uncharacterized protein LOC103312261 isoform X4 n=1 Tax=Tribolium castaneum TaxID=7070 RepID=UPI00077DDFD9|nr:PREDICTED: uncharacterized protein LOC103312261 isoform X3 [Tribolium castaneum]|eukprot:XP_015833125.1 PREDICTED: uncharacterized protein LOC103312261 isoform X3 [Tribolium castaneum]